MDPLSSVGKVEPPQGLVLPVDSRGEVVYLGSLGLDLLSPFDFTWKVGEG